ncbi:MAG: acylneuraminate cytidylyltransferase family protein [Holosporaceae bacterium]|nr:acylneuraminate cytidylyltransferase family protein [Holosporaceae bacterium]
MYNNKKILAIIPARGGSKGLPGKNIRDLCGKPLVARTIDQAKNCQYIDKIFVSTDSEEIAKVSSDFGIEVPFLRPKKLAADNSSSVDVVAHVLDELEARGEFFDYMVLLEPTSPLRKKNDIKSAVEAAIENPDTDGVLSLGEVHMEHPSIVKKLRNGKIESYFQNTGAVARRQDLDTAYFPYGVIYMIKIESFRLTNKIYTSNMTPYIIERWQNYEVDDIWDFICIEAIFREKQEEIW